MLNIDINKGSTVNKQVQKADVAISKLCK